MFLRNLLLGENNPLQNRTMHISGIIAKPDIRNEKPDIEDRKPDIQLFLDRGLSQKTSSNVLKLYNKFGIRTVFGRTEVMDTLGLSHSGASDLLKKLVSVGITESVSGLGKGKYRFNPRFFR